MFLHQVPTLEGLRLKVHRRAEILFLWTGAARKNLACGALSARAGLLSSQAVSLRLVSNRGLLGGFGLTIRV